MMADVVDQATRSRIMAGIKGANTKPEIALRKAMHALGLRFRLHAKGMPGRPDIVLPRWKAVILVHGCFWHRHEGCRYATVPRTRPEFWHKKFASNVDRDQRNLEDLGASGWRTRVVWECELNKLGARHIAEDIKGWLAMCASGQ